MNQPRRKTAELILYVTGDAPRSVRARANLERALESLALPPDTAREIDLIETPGEAIRRGIFATPALVRDGAEDRPAILYGDLSDERRLQQFLSSLVRSPSHDGA